ncbi:MAG TPA: DNA translocase FtsK [Feifaniaceae bacterium]|nr:DNA translocase FtsK [Feifaniaceae bacterium]
MAKRRPKKRKEAVQSRREIWGVALIAVGVFLGACIYFGQAGLIGEAIRSVSYGLGGLFAYALPPVCVIGGVALIAIADQKPKKGRTALVFTGIWLVLALLHVIARPVLGETPFLPYVRDAYVYGTAELSGGGALGALLSYPLLLLTGEAGSYIFLIAGILIITLLVTSISLRVTGRQVTTKVKEGFQQAAQAHAARRELYTATIDEEEAIPVPRPRKPARRPAKTAKSEEEDDLSFMPIEGPLQKRTQAGEAQDPFLPPLTAPPVFAEDPDADDFPPFEPDDFAATPLRAPKKPMRETLPFAEPVQVKLNLEPEQKAGPLPAHSAQDIPYVPPSFSLLNPALANYGRSNESPAEKGKLLVDTLASFNVSARVVNISVGPVITRFELAPAPGVRVNRITALSDDIALALAAPRVRIEAPIPGKAAVGIEVPNKDTVTVVLRDAVDSREFAASKSPITLALGKDIAGKVIVADLAKMPHLLIAGATGSGKSVCINDIIISLIYKCSPADLQLILVDPKVVELSAFSVLPHLKVPVVTDPKKAAGALAGGVREMTERYKRFAKVGARDIERFNELQKDPKEKLPKLVIIIDELADLMMVAPDTVEDSICRIAQLGRAAGIHLIVATQRPSADVITGLIKANIPSRIAFAVSSAIDSRIILDSGGAEKLLGRGDMLFHPNGAGKAVRVQGAYVSDEEVERIVQYFKSQALTPEFDEHLIEEMDVEEGSGAQGNGKQEDDLLGEAVRIVLDSGQASISMIQRRLRVGYARAARLIDIMEQHGYVSGFDGAKPRKLLITRAQYEQIFGSQPDIGEDMDE